MLQPQPPTHTRYLVVLSAMLVAVLLYLDRFCISFAEIYIKQDLGLTDSQVGWMLSAFFWTYALAQVPSGWLSDRFGGRVMLTIYVLGWSLFTGLTGLAFGFAAILGMRLMFGVFQAGAYPTSASLVSKWMPFSARGTASSCIAWGGRVGLGIAMILTAYLLAHFVPTTVSSRLTTGDLLRAPEFCYHLRQTAADPLPTKADNPQDKARRNVSKTILDRLSPDVGRPIVQIVADRYQQALDAKNVGKAEKERIKRLSLEEMADGIRPVELQRLVADLNRILDQPDFYNPADYRYVALPNEAKRYRETLQADPRSLEKSELTRLNRLLLEGMYRDYIKKVYVAGWRKVMWLYGALGLVVAALYWYCVRDRPQDHPRCNREEQALIEQGRPAEATQPHGKVGGVPWGRILRSRSMWLICVAQFFTNAGWIFLVTWAPRYLTDHHGVPVESRGWMTLAIAAVGWLGMLGGGRLTDGLVKLVGLRWGRALPMSLSRFMAMAAYLYVLFLYWTQESFNPWLAVAGFAFVAFSTDLGAGATWAFKQDVGGRYVGSILGFGNMCGNFGAAVFSWALIRIAGEGLDKHWDWVFLTCASGFFISGLAALGVNAAIPVALDEEEDELRSSPSDSQAAEDTKDDGGAGTD